MLAQIEKPHNDFFRLAEYLIHGDERPTSPDRVAWVFGHNLPTDDPVLAAKLMTATADLSKRCRNACYHTMVAWHPEESPSPEIMQEIARRTLVLAGLGEHQALVMGHGDKPHRHLHMMINRVHPETGRAWSTSHDYRRFDQIMRQLSEDYGLRYVPPHTFHPETTDEMPKGPDSNATYAARRGASTDRPQWPRSLSRAYGRLVSEHIDAATSWDDLEHLFAEDCFTLEWKGNGAKAGLVVGDGSAYSKLSALGLTASAKSLERRFGRKFKPQGSPRRNPPIVKVHAWRKMFTVDAVDIARAVGTREQLRHAIQDAVGARKARLSKAPLTKQLEAELQEALKATTSLTPPNRRKPRGPARSRRKPSRREPER